MTKTPAQNKNYMSIAVSVQNWKFTARHNSGGVRQESGSQSATAYSFEMSWRILITNTNRA
mgnify:CR=1 FL=1